MIFLVHQVISLPVTIRTTGPWYTLVTNKPFHLKLTAGMFSHRYVTDTFTNIFVFMNVDIHESSHSWIFWIKKADIHNQLIWIHIHHKEPMWMMNKTLNSWIISSWLVNNSSCHALPQTINVEVWFFCLHIFVRVCSPQIKTNPFGALVRLIGT